MKPFCADSVVIGLLEDPGRSRWSNDALNDLIGGTDAQWGAWQKGSRPAMVAPYLYTKLRDHDLGLVNISVRRWELHSFADSMHELAAQRLGRVDNHFKNAIKAIDELSKQTDNAELKRDCEAWLELANGFLSKDTVAIFTVWSNELRKITPQLKLV